MKKLLCIITIFSAFQTVGQEQFLNIDEIVSQREIKAHIGFLASDELRGREVGSPEIEIAARYLATQLEAYGADPVGDDYFLPVKFNFYSRPQTQKIRINKKNYDQIILMEGSNINSTEKMVYVEYGTPEDFSTANVEGKLVLSQAGNSAPFDVRKALNARKEKIALAKENGAIGLIELLPTTNDFWARIKHFFDHEERVELDSGEAEDFVHLWVLDSEPDKFKKGKPVSAECLISGVAEKRVVSNNILATITGSDAELKDEYIVYSAHYDHVGVGQPDAAGDSIFNGARDNAVGVSTVLMAAKYFGKNRPKRSVLFALFTGEEKGVLGSEWFVPRSPVALDRMTYCLNSDNAGYTDKSAATIVGLSRTTAGTLIKESIEEAGLQVIADPMAEQGLYDRSDNVHFAKAGIPAANISMGIDSFDENIQRVYHQAADNPETLDYEYLKRYFRAYIHVAHQLANNPDTPYWVDGDKYYEAGEKLYKKN